ncbi:KGG domain-containing protein [Polluticoccus soli]|uniref:KGG domain-containing protein n=1 Tax=Polluticoccus soli TaxID=3034150 RepID=UPI0023E28440|nr:KGG domain-containing protein [Flavipsychrobacter sp. JY13-12]
MADINQSSKGNTPSKTSNRGFASMDPQKQREIASKGGHAVSGNREHMAEIGRRGGEASGESRRNHSNGNNENNSGQQTANEQSLGERA